jgi:hypothetical protein
MREFNALAGYPEPEKPRFVGPDLRTIHHRIVASYRGKDLYDGDRNYGYGGFKYDGRWVPIVRDMADEYELDGSSSVLQVNCEKGFILHDFKEQVPGIRVRGTEVSQYAIDQAMDSVKSEIVHSPFTDLPFGDGEFDFVLAMGAVYSLNLADAIQCLKEIQRVGKGKSFITLAAYETEQGKRLFEWWTLLGTTLLRKEEWVEVMRHVGYAGDYKFTTADSLNLSQEGG